MPAAMSHAIFPAVEGHTADGRSSEAAAASQINPSPVLQVEQVSQETGSVITYTPPLLPRYTISPCLIRHRTNTNKNAE